MIFLTKGGGLQNEHITKGKGVRQYHAGRPQDQSTLN